jgi:hypothetical protein
MNSKDIAAPEHCNVKACPFPIYKDNKCKTHYADYTFVEQSTIPSVMKEVMLSSRYMC